MDYVHELESIKKEMGTANWLMKVNGLRRSIQSGIDIKKRQLEAGMKTGKIDSFDELTEYKTAIDVYSRLLSLDIHEALDYECVGWMYNGGYLRSEKEIDDKIKDIKAYQNHIKIQDLYATDKTFTHKHMLAESEFIWLPFAVPITIGLIYGLFCGQPICGVCFFSFILLPVIGMPLAIIGALLGQAHVNDINKEYGVGSDDSFAPVAEAVIGCAALAMLVDCRKKVNTVHHTEI